jgi:TP901 family phage tail tape measure protein
MAGMSAFYFPLRQVQMGISHIYELDKAMIDLKKVTDETTQSYRDFGMEANSMANSIGSTTVDIIKATTEFSRLGYEMNQAKTMAQQAMVFANVGDTDFQSATKSLISTMKGFNIEADASGKNIEKIVDLYNEIGNSFAISTAGVGEAMRRSSASLKSAGNTIEESVALVVAANSAIQDPVKVGTAWKTVSMRIRGISEEGEDLSHLIPTLEKSFDKLGLSLKKNDNTFKSTFEIMRDLSTVWKNMSDFEQADILEKIAGKRQGNIIAAAISNFADAQKAVEVGLNSQGSSAKELENFLDGIEARLNKFKNSMVGFWQTALNSEGLKDVLELGTDLIKLLTSMVDKFGLLAPVVGTASIAIIALNTSMRTNAMSAGMKMGQTLKYVTSSMYALATGTASTNKALLANTIAVRGVTLSLHGLKAVASSTMAFLGGAVLPLAGMMALGFAIEKLVSAHIKAGEEAKKIAAEEKKLLDTWTQQEDKIRSLVDRHEELNRVTKDGAKFKNNEQEQEYLDIQNELGSLLPSLVKSVDENGQSHLRSSQAISEEVKILEELVRLKKEEKFLNSQQDFEDSKSQIEKLIEERDKIIKSLEEGTKRVLSSSSSTNFGLDWEEVLLSDEDINNFRQKSNRLQVEINKLNEQLAADNFLVNIEFALDDKEITQEAKQAILDLAQTIDLVSLEPEQYNETLRNVAEAFSLVESNANPKFLIEYANATGISHSWLLKLKESMTEVNDLVEEESIGFFDLTKELKSFTDATNDLKSAYDSLNNGKQLSVDQIRKLITDYPELISALETEEGQLTLNKEAIDKLIKAKEIDFKNTLAQQQTELENQETLLQNKLKMYLDEVEAIGKVDEATKKLIRTKMLEKFLPNSIEEYNAMDLSDFEKMVSTAMGYVEQLESVQAQANGIKALMGADLSSGTGTGATSNIPSTSTYTPYETDTFAQSINNLDTKIAQLQGRLSALDKTSEEYRQGQRELVALFEQKQQLTSKQADDLRHENELIKQRLDTEKLTREERDKLQQQYDDNKNTINSLSRVWWDYKSNIISANKAIKDSFNEVEEAAKRLKEEFSNEIFRYMDYEIEQLERSKRKAQQTAQVKIDALQNEIDRLEDRNNLLQEEEERQRRLLDLSKQRQKLENIQREKNVRLFQNGEFVWVADPRKVREETERLQELESDYRQWEIENTRRHEIQRLQDQIKSIQDELKKEEDKYDQQITNLRDFMTEYKREQFNFSQEQLATINTLIEGIKGMENASYAERLSMIQTFVSRYNSILGQMQSTSTSGSPSPSPPTPSNPLGMSDADYQTYLQNKKNWDDGINRTKANMENEILRRKYGIGSDQHSYSDLSKTTPPKTNDILKTSVNTRIGVVKKKPIIAKPKIPTLASKTIGGTGDTNYTINVDKVQTNDASNFIKQIKGMVRS